MTNESSLMSLVTDRFASQEDRRLCCELRNPSPSSVSDAKSNVPTLERNDDDWRNSRNESRKDDDRRFPRT